MKIKTIKPIDFFQFIIAQLKIFKMMSTIA